MMKNFLEHNFIAHYQLRANVTVNVEVKNEDCFELIDHVGKGRAKYCNPHYKEVNIIDYETFFKSLPQCFQNNKYNCDFIVHTSDKQYFLLNELTNTNKGKGRKRTHAIEQMLQTLQIILAVDAIKSCIKQHFVRHCCYFNKKVQVPQAIRAVSAFNRINSYSANGYRMPNPEIESFGFELWEFSGDQTYLL